MKTLTVALAQSPVVAPFFAVPSFADDEEALNKDVVPCRCVLADVSQEISVGPLT